MILNSYNTFFVLPLILQISVFRQTSAMVKEKNWSFELLDVDCSCENTDNCEIDCEIVRVSRGVFAMDGFIDLKIDVDDSTTIEGSLYRSNTVGNNYQKLPLEIANETLTVTMNEYYKKFLMNDIQNCSTNAPFFENFEAPLTKRKLELRHCNVSTDNLPSHMSEGLYKLNIIVYGPSKLMMSISFKIENERN